MTTAPIVPESAPPPPFRVDAWEVRPASAELVHEGRVLRLEPRVMGVLVCLARHAPGVVRRQDLLREVWNGAFVSEDVIWRCISDLRRAFGDDARRLVETLPRLGYRLTVPVTALDPGAGERALAAAGAATHVSNRRRRYSVAALAGIVAVLGAAWVWRHRPSVPMSGAPAAPAPVDESAVALVRRGDAFYWRSGAKEKIRAAAFYERAVAADPAFAPAWAALAGTHAWRFVDTGDRGALDRAHAAAERALELDPRLVAGYKALAQAETLRGRLDNAVQASLRALELEPGAAVVEYNLACIHAARGELDRATTLFRRSPLLTTGPAAIACAYARTLRELGATAEARTLAARAAAAEPLDPCTTSLLAWLDHDAGAPQRGLPAVLRALDLTPDSTDLLATAAALEEAVGQPAAALAHLRALRPAGEPLVRARLARLVGVASAEGRAALAAERADAEGAIAGGDERAEPRLMLAGNAGALGRGDESLRHLRDAIARGYSDGAMLRSEPLFAAARAAPGFAALAAGLEARLAAQRGRAALPELGPPLPSERIGAATPRR